MEDNQNQILTWGHELVGVDTNIVDKKVKIAILDSGINKQHEDLKGKVVKEYNTFTDGVTITDEFGHGTAVAGIISANNNNYGIVGITQNVEIYDVKVLDNSGKGSMEQLIKGIKWAIEQKVDILNISFGLQSDSRELKELIKSALSENIIIVASAGNTYGLNVDYPAKFNDVFSISALNENVKRASSAAKGKIDFIAPGVNVLSTDHIGGYSLFSGTSFSTAYVTGVIATILCRTNEKINSEMMKEKLIKQSKHLGEKKEYGYGIPQLIEE
ncbi:S8 family serine peptidase [Bacillus sp. Y1]|nr:S8 family serine peptidase [Bacillus sp. Y1]